MGSIYGTSGPDHLVGAVDAETIWGWAGSDTIDGGAGEDRLHGGGGADILAGGLDPDRIFAGTGNDTIEGDEGADTARGAAGDDSVAGGEGDDRLGGDDGDDTLSGGAGDDTLHGGAGADRLDGGDGADWLGAGRGDDRIDGGSGADTLGGGAGDDTLDGGVGDDRLTGGRGSDDLTGGDGADTFVFNRDQIDGDWVQWRAADGGNGHWYEAVVADHGISWTAAKAAAESLAPGAHLATITSASENAFGFAVATHEPLLWIGGRGPWLGAYQPAGSAEPCGGWTWVTGESFDYTDWQSGEPNDNGGQDHLHFEDQRSGRWDDIDVTGRYFGGFVGGYLVEVDSLPASNGRDIVRDFTPGEDRIDLSAFGLADFAAVTGLLAQTGADVSVSLHQLGGRDVLLEHTSLASLHAGDFIL